MASTVSSNMTFGGGADGLHAAPAGGGDRSSMDDTESDQRDDGHSASVSWHSRANSTVYETARVDISPGVRVSTAPSGGGNSAGVFATGSGVNISPLSQNTPFDSGIVRGRLAYIRS